MDKKVILLAIVIILIGVFLLLNQKHSASPGLMPRCGDGSCSSGENCSLCLQDCGSCAASPKSGRCSDGICKNTPELKLLFKGVIVSPKDGNSHSRGELVAVDNRLFLAFNEWDGTPFKLAELNEDLTYKWGPIDIFSDDDPSTSPTDIRLASDGPDLWYAFETTKGGVCNFKNHFLNAAIYDVSGAVPTLVASKSDIVSGCSMSKDVTGTVPRNPEVVDDPTPFFHDGRYVILTRAWSGAVQHVRTFDRNLTKLEDFTLDLSATIGDRTLSQNALVDIEGQVYLIGGLGNDYAPINPKADSSIYAIPLSSDLHSISGKKILLLSGSGSYYSKVTSAKYSDGKLYINYGESTIGVAQSERNHLGVFDVTNGFAPLYKINLQDEYANLDHGSIELIGDKVFALYQIGNKLIKVDVYQWQA